MILISRFTLQLYGFTCNWLHPNTSERLLLQQILKLIKVAGCVYLPFQLLIEPKDIIIYLIFKDWIEMYQFDL